MGVIIRKKSGSSYEKICRAEVYVEELGLEEAVKRFKEEEKEKSIIPLLFRQGHNYHFISTDVVKTGVR